MIYSISTEHQLREYTSVRRHRMSKPCFISSFFYKLHPCTFIFQQKNIKLRLIGMWIFSAFYTSPNVVIGLIQNLGLFLTIFVDLVRSACSDHFTPTQPNALRSH